MADEVAEFFKELDEVEVNLRKARGVRRFAGSGEQEQAKATVRGLEDERTFIMEGLTRVIFFVYTWRIIMSIKFRFLEVKNLKNFLIRLKKNILEEKNLA
jgi:hypothetical protein